MRHAGPDHRREDPRQHSGICQAVAEFSPIPSRFPNNPALSVATRRPVLCAGIITIGKAYRINVWQFATFISRELSCALPSFFLAHRLRVEWVADLKQSAVPSVEGIVSQLVVQLGGTSRSRSAPIRSAVASERLAVVIANHR